MKSKLFYNIARYLLAALFVFSGLTKGVNPFGLSIQFNEYFSALSLPFLTPLSPLCAIVLPAGETLLGLLLAFGLMRGVTRWAVVVVMGFFTMLTLWIAVANPVNDCGCFGDVIKLSNWATFAKNVFFCALAVVYFINKTPPSRPLPGGVAYVLLMAMASLALPLYCYWHLPMIDVTPYAKGNNIASLMRGTLHQESTTELIYRNLQTGRERTFSITDTTWQDDSQWAYVDTRTTTLTTGLAPRISSLAMIDLYGQDRAPEILSQPGYLFLLVVPDPMRLTEDENEWTADLIRGARQRDASVVLLTAVEFRAASDSPFSDLMPMMVDRSVLQTMIQNRIGGVILLENGTVIDKWAL
ncbi:MAG: hypothetical protein RSA94_02250 [Mucinivorans sp.]